MSSTEDKQVTNEERAEISKRKLEMSLHKKTRQTTSLSDLKKELGLPEKGIK